MFKLLKKTETTRQYSLELSRKAINEAVSEEQMAAQNAQKRVDIDTIASYAFHKVIQKKLQEIQAKEGVTLLNIENVALDEKDEASPDAETVRCTVDTECLPKVPWTGLKDAPHVSIEFKPTDAEIKTIAQDELKQKAGELIDKPSVEKTSFVQVKISCTVDGKSLPAYTAQKAYVDMNKGDFWPEVIKDLEGKKISDSFTTKVKLTDTASPLLRNKEAVFYVTVLGIKAFLPAEKADDNAAKKIGLKSWEDFLKKFKEHVIQTGTKTAQEMEHKAIMSLVSALDFDVPKSIRAERLEHQKTSALKSVAPRKKLSQEELSYVEEAAERESKLVTFVLSYAKEKDISVSSKDIKAVYTPKTPEEREFYEGILLEGKVLESLKTLLKISKKELSFKELQEKISDRA